MSRSRSRSQSRSPSPPGDRPATVADLAGRLGDGSHRQARHERVKNREWSKYYDDYMKQPMREYDETAKLDRIQNANLYAWLESAPGYNFFGPKAGWPAYCNNSVNTWQYYHDHPRANAAKLAYDEWDQKRREKDERKSKSKNQERSRSSHSRGGAVKRTKFNKRKSSSRVLSKSRRRTHRK